MENGFSVDTQDWCLRNINTSQVISCSVGWIAMVLLMEEESVEDGEILLSMNANKQYFGYAQCFSAEQAVRLPEHKYWDHQIPLQDPNVLYSQGLSTRPPGRKMKPLGNTCKKTSPQGRLDSLALLLLHQSQSCKRKTDSSYSVSLTDLSTI